MLIDPEKREADIQRLADEMESLVERYDSSLKRRLAEIDEHKVRLVEQISQLDTWKDAHERRYVEMVEKYRGYMEALLDRWHKIAFAAIIATPVVLFGIAQLLNSWITGLKEETRKQADTIRAETFKKLEADTSKEQLQSSAIQLARDSLRNELHRELVGDIVTSVATTLTRVSSNLRQSLGSTSRHEKNVEVVFLQDLAYDADMLAQTYVSELSSAAGQAGKIPIDHAFAVQLLTDGLEARSYANEAQAQAYFNLAIQHDPAIPESYLFLSRIEASRVMYNGANKWGDPDALKRFVGYVQQAIRLGKTSINPDIQTLVAALLRTQGKFKEAIDALEQQQITHPTDPRFSARQANYCWDMLVDHPEDTALRNRMLDYFRKAIKAQPDYIAALNNFIWNSTHNNDRVGGPGKEFSLVTSQEPYVSPDAETKPERIKSITEFAQELRGRLEILSQRPEIYHQARFLNTIAEGYFWLRDHGRYGTADKNAFSKRAEYWANASVAEFVVYGLDVQSTAVTNRYKTFYGFAVDELAKKGSGDFLSPK